MKARNRKQSSIYQFLEPVLQTGGAKEIALARTQYWREYKANWRRQKRRSEKELTTSWTKDELKILTEAAKKHKVSITRFIKTSSLAYIDKRYIIPDQLEVRRIAQHLAMTYNSIQEMVNENELNLQTGKIILEKIFELERTFLVSLHNPKTLEQLITEAVKTSPKMKATLFELLENLPTQ